MQGTADTNFSLGRVFPETAMQEVCEMYVSCGTLQLFGIQRLSQACAMLFTSFRGHACKQILRLREQIVPATLRFQLGKNPRTHRFLLVLGKLDGLGDRLLK